MTCFIEDLHNTIRDATVIDLSTTLEIGIPRWPTHPPLLVGAAATHARDGYANQWLALGEHTGTHIDAPYHIHGDQSELTVDQIELTAVIGRAVVLDLSFKAWEPGERAGIEDIMNALSDYPTGIREGDIVLACFGWMKYWKTTGEWAEYASNQPGFTEEAADFFIEKKIRAIGTDTAAVGTPIKAGQSGRCYFHEKVLREQIYLIECLNNLEQLPRSCFFMALPLKIKGGSGSPIRAIALTSREARSRWGRGAL